MDKPKHVSADSYMSYKDGGKVQKVMHEYKAGTLHSGSKTGPQVKSREQAVAIALSEARKAGEKVPAKKYQEGGAVTGPGGPREDAIPAKLSNGEYVIPAHIVSYLGTAFFDKIVQQTEAQMGTAAPSPFAEMATNDMGEMEPAGGMPGGMS